MVHKIWAILGKLSSPNSAGAYSNYYKAEEDAKGNPAGYYIASNSIKRAAKDLGLPDSWIQPAIELVARESSFNTSAKNPNSSAKGLFQFLDGTRKDYGGSGVDWNDPYQQALAGLKYIKDRYKSPENALRYWDKNKSY